MPIQNVILWLCLIGIALLFFIAYTLHRLRYEEEQEKQKFQQTMRERYGNNDSRRSN